MMVVAPSEVCSTGSDWKAWAGEANASRAHGGDVDG
jgi:hypothetical protein